MIKSNAALKYWLVFFGLFLLAGLSVEQSFVMGGLAAIAGGMIVQWWEITEEKPKPEPTTAKTPQFIGKLPSRFMERFSIGKRSVQQQSRKGQGGLFGLFPYRQKK